MIHVGFFSVRVLDRRELLTLFLDYPSPLPPLSLSSLTHMLMLQCV